MQRALRDSPSQMFCRLSCRFFGLMPKKSMCLLNVGNTKQKNTVNLSEHSASMNPGERIYTDIASIRPTNGMTVSKPHWCIKVDECTQLKFSSFHAHKDDMVKPSCEMFHKWSQGGNTVKYVRCDNAGENRTLQTEANGADWKLNIEF
jgi:hypothetical protein